jgi:RecA-family ATPase
MASYLSEALYRACTRDVYSHWAAHRAAYTWILSVHDNAREYETVTTKALEAVLSYIDKYQRCPSTPAAVIDYIRSNPVHVEAFGKSEKFEEEFECLKEFEPTCAEMDTEVLFANLLEQAKLDHYKTGMQQAARIASGASSEKNKDKKRLGGVDDSRAWLANYLATTGYKDTTDTLVEDTTGLEWAGVGIDDDGDTRTLRIQTMEQVEITELQWLWPGKIPSGKLCILSGKPGKGKTLSLLDWVARVTTGRDWPDGSPNEFGARRVLLCSAEDDPGDTTKPRLIAAGADLSKVCTFRITTRPKDSDNEHGAVLNLKKDLITLTTYIEKNPDIAVLVLDPLTSYIGGLNINREEEIHPLLDKLIKLGQKTGITIFALVHSSKRSDVDAMQQVMGATCVSGSARTVWTFAQDSEDENLYRMVNAKGNLLKNKNGFEYAIEGVDVPVNGKMLNHPVIKWGKETGMKADDVMKQERSNKDGKDTKAIMAVAIIKSMMPCKAKDIYRKAEDEGISVETIKRSKHKMPEIITRQINKEWWWWTLENPPAETTKAKPTAATTAVFQQEEDEIISKMEDVA